MTAVSLQEETECFNQAAASLQATIESSDQAADTTVGETVRKSVFIDSLLQHSESNFYI